MLPIAKNTCILHIGMPKTGTSAIQQYLCYELEDTAFRYVNFGRQDGSGLVGLATIFLDKPENWYFHKKAGLSETSVNQLKDKFFHLLEHEVSQAREHNQILMLSGESCWRMNASEFSRIQAYFQNHGFSVHIVGYIRPWKAWLESSFQQNVKTGDQLSFLPHSKAIAQLNYQHKFQLLEGIFGKSHVHFYLYDTKIFPGACIVQDFCSKTGISYTKTTIRRANESLALPAIQLLYAAIKYQPGFEEKVSAIQFPESLINQLQELQGQPLRFHSSLIEPILKPYIPQISWLKEHIGVSLEEDIYAFDHIAIRSENHLLDFAPAAIQWLSEYSGEKFVHPMGSLSFKLEVANRMHHLIQQDPKRPDSAKTKPGIWIFNWLKRLKRD